MIKQDRSIIMAVLKYLALYFEHSCYVSKIEHHTKYFLVF